MSFGGYKVRMDPWQAEYGSEAPLELVSTEGTEGVNLDVEVAGGKWSPIPGDHGATVDNLAFVDGVRRLEARINAGRDGLRPCHGAFGSVAAGVVSIRDGAAEITHVDVRRSCVLGSGEKLPGPVAVEGGLVYQASSTPENDTDAPLAEIQHIMRMTEAEAARAAVRAGAGLVIADGRLQLAAEPTTRIVGYIKRIFQLYLPDRFFPFLENLPRKTRTPIFSIAASKDEMARYSWFLRLADPFPGEALLSGLVRLELPAAAGLETARALAGATAAVLPRFVPPRARDPRSPQNLLPIGGLEAHLRRRLGDPRLIRRRIHALLIEEAENERNR